MGGSVISGYAAKWEGDRSVLNQMDLWTANDGGVEFSINDSRNRLSGKLLVSRATTHRTKHSSQRINSSLERLQTMIWMFQYRLQQCLFVTTALSSQSQGVTTEHPLTSATTGITLLPNGTLIECQLLALQDVSIRASALSRS